MSQGGAKAAKLLTKDEARRIAANIATESEPERRSAAKLLSKDKAIRIAANIAKLPNLLSKGS